MKMGNIFELHSLALLTCLKRLNQTNLRVWLTQQHHRPVRLPDLLLQKRSQLKNEIEVRIQTWSPPHKKQLLKHLKHKTISELHILVNKLGKIRNRHPVNFDTPIGTPTVSTTQRRRTRSTIGERSPWLRTPKPPQSSTSTSTSLALLTQFTSASSPVTKKRQYSNLSLKSSNTNLESND